MQIFHAGALDSSTSEKTILLCFLYISLFLNPRVRSCVSACVYWLQVVLRQQGTTGTTWAPCLVYDLFLLFVCERERACEWYCSSIERQCFSLPDESNLYLLALSEAHARGLMKSLEGESSERKYTKTKPTASLFLQYITHSLHFFSLQTARLEQITERKKREIQYFLLCAIL